MPRTHTTNTGTHSEFSTNIVKRLSGMASAISARTDMEPKDVHILINNLYVTLLNRQFHAAGIDITTMNNDILANLYSSLLANIVEEDEEQS